MKKNPRNRIWTKAELAYLAENYETIGPKAMMKHLGRSQQAIVTKAHDMKIGRKKPRLPPAPLRPPVHEQSATLAAVLKYLVRAGFSIAFEGNGVYRVNGARKTPHQLAAIANDHRVRNTNLPILRLGAVDPAQYSATGCSAAMAAGV